MGPQQNKPAETSHASELLVTRVSTCVHKDLNTSLSVGRFPNNGRPVNHTSSSPQWKIATKANIRKSVHHNYAYYRDSPNQAIPFIASVDSTVCPLMHLAIIMLIIMPRLQLGTILSRPGDHISTDAPNAQLTPPLNNSGIKTATPAHPGKLTSHIVDMEQRFSRGIEGNYLSPVNHR